MAKHNHLLQEGDPAPSKAQPASVTNAAPQPGGAGMGVGLYALVLVGAVAAFGAYKYLQANSESGK